MFGGVGDGGAKLAEMEEAMTRVVGCWAESWRRLNLLRMAGRSGRIGEIRVRRCWRWRSKISGSGGSDDTGGVTDVGVGSWRSCHCKGVVYLGFVAEILAIMVTTMGVSMISRVVFCSAGRSTRATSRFGRCIHVIRTHPCNKGRFFGMAIN